MRITSIGRGSLAATCLLLGVANGQSGGPGIKVPENRFVKFTEGFFDPQGNSDGAILLDAEGVASKYRHFTWESDGPLVGKIYLQSSDINGRFENITIGSAIQQVPSPVTATPTTSRRKPDVTATGSSPSLTPQTSIDNGGMLGGPGGFVDPSGRTGRRRQADSTLPTSPLGMTMSLRDNGGEVSFDSIRLRGNGHNYTEGSILFFMAEWGNGGRSYSRRFTIVFSEEASTQAVRANVFGNPQPYAREADVMGGGGGSSDGGIDTPTNTTTPKSGTPSGGSSASGGLGQGAIIGIAVGCGVVGLLLVFGIVWLVVRRRKLKQSAHPGGSYNAERRGEDLIAEKEANAGVDEDAASGAPIAGAVAAHHRQDQARSYTPYSDLPGATGSASIHTASISHNDESRANVPSPIPGRATPRGLTTPYAHLVEEGMTEEEIRRLEEEERQLDAAIEQAGRV